MVARGVSRRGFLGSALATAASLTTGNVSDSSGRVRAQEPNNQSGTTKTTVIHRSDFDKIIETTLDRANELFSELDIWKSLSYQEKKDFCKRLHETILFVDGKSTNQVTSNFLDNLNKILKSDSISLEQKRNFFKLKHYLMLDLALERINRFNPKPEVIKAFLADIISRSGITENSDFPVRTISLSQQIDESRNTTEKMIEIYKSLKKKHFTD